MYEKNQMKIRQMKISFNICYVNNLCKRFSFS